MSNTPPPLPPPPRPVHKNDTIPGDGRFVDGKRFFLHLGPRGHHQRFPIPWQLLPQGFGDIGHEGVQQAKTRVEHVHEGSSRTVGALVRAVGVATGEGSDSRLACFDVPVVVVIFPLAASAHSIRG